MTQKMTRYQIIAAIKDAFDHVAVSRAELDNLDRELQEVLSWIEDDMIHALGPAIKAAIDRPAAQ